MATLVALWVAAYLVGAVPTTYLMAKAVRGIDLRAQGSGNVGASNLASQLGKFWYLPVVVIDLTRGGGPVALGYYLLGADGLAWGLAVTPLFTVTGNNWSPFLRFTGGRGVGVWAGGLLAMSPTLFAAALAVHLAGWMATRRSAEWLAVVMTVLPIACILLAVGLVADNFAGAVGGLRRCRSRFDFPKANPCQRRTATQRRAGRVSFAEPAVQRSRYFRPAAVVIQTIRRNRGTASVTPERPTGYNHPHPNPRSTRANVPAW